MSKKTYIRKEHLQVSFYSSMLKASVHMIQCEGIAVPNMYVSRNVAITSVPDRVTLGIPDA